LYLKTLTRRIFEEKEEEENTKILPPTLWFSILFQIQQVSMTCLLLRDIATC